MIPTRNPIVVALVAALVFPSVAAAQAIASTSSTPDSTPRLPSDGDDIVPEKLTFDVAIQRALSRNPASREAAAEIRRYRALRDEVRAASLPTLTGAAVYMRLDSNRVAGGPVLQPEGGVNLSATLSVPIVNVRAWAKWQQADDRLDVAGLDPADRTVRRDDAD